MAEVKFAMLGLEEMLDSAHFTWKQTKEKKISQISKRCSNHFGSLHTHLHLL